MTNQIFIRNMNERRVLTLLRKEGSLSRAEIARRLLLTRSGVTYLVDALLEQNLVNEAAVNPTAAPSRELGRPGVALTLNPTGHYFLGVEIGVGVVRLALVDMALEPVRTETIDLPQSPEPQYAIKLIKKFLNDCESDKRYKGRVRAIGVTVPGLVRRNYPVAPAVHPSGPAANRGSGAPAAIGRPPIHRYFFAATIAA